MYLSECAYTHTHTHTCSGQCDRQTAQTTCAYVYTLPSRRDDCQPREIAAYYRRRGRVESRRQFPSTIRYGLKKHAVEFLRRRRRRRTNNISLLLLSLSLSLLLLLLLYSYASRFEFVTRRVVRNGKTNVPGRG